MLRRRVPGPRRHAFSSRMRVQSLHRLIPNILTLMSLCSGLTAIRFAMEERWQATVIAIILAAIFDGLDGRIARLIGATSKFGAELDSLCDFVCFGVVPALVLYLWVMADGGRIGWAVVLIYAICMALRLARFNTALDDDTRPPWTSHFFTGVPAPAAAALVLMPLIADIEFPGDPVGTGPARSPIAVGIWILIVAGLMVSRVPTFSMKKVRVPHVWVLPILILVGIVGAGLAAEPWLTILLIGLAYLASIPFSMRVSARLQRAQARMASAGVEPDTVPPGAEPPAPPSSATPQG